MSYGSPFFGDSLPILPGYGASAPVSIAVELEERRKRWRKALRDADRGGPISAGELEPLRQIASGGWLTLHAKRAMQRMRAVQRLRGLGWQRPEEQQVRPDFGPVDFPAGRMLPGQGFGPGS